MAFNGKAEEAVREQMGQTQEVLSITLQGLRAIVSGVVADVFANGVLTGLKATGATDEQVQAIRKDLYELFTDMQDEHKAKQEVD